jgi:hypothetical protein
MRNSQDGARLATASALPTRRSFLTALGTIAGGSAAVTATPTDTQVRPDNRSSNDSSLHNPTFDDGLTGWAVGHDVIKDNGAEAHPAPRAEPVPSPQNGDDTALALSVDAAAARGVVWVAQRVDFSTVHRVSTAVYSPRRVFGDASQLVVYAGPDPATLTSDQFDAVAPIHTHRGWWRASTRPIQSTDEGLLAVGVRAAWQPERKHVIDTVRLHHSTRQPPETVVW